MRGEAGKPRPAVVVQADEARPEAPNTLIVCPLTSVLRGGGVRPRVRPGALNQLDVASEVMVERIQSAPVERIRRSLGRLAEAEMAEVDAALMLVLGLGATSSRSPR